MDHACHQCGREIEEGTPFCRHCGAPQIRIPGMEEAGVPGTASEAPAEAPLPPQPVAIRQAPLAAPAGVEWPHALPSAAWAGALLAAAWIIPYIGYFLWILAAGAVAVAIYRRRLPDAPVTPGIGARIGALCGLFGFAGFSCLMAVGLLLLRGSTKFRELLQQAMQQAAASNPDPAAQDVLKQMTSPAGLALIMTIVMVVFLIGFIGLSAAGGAIGAKLFRNKTSNQ